MQSIQLTRGQTTVPAFFLEGTDKNKYTMLRGFSHGTSGEFLDTILNSGQLICSYDRRAQQIAAGQHPTGSDWSHEGQYAVYFRYVIKKAKRGILGDILLSMASVGSSGGLVFFFPFDQAIQIQKPFTLAGGIDGIGGTNVITAQRIQDARAKGLIKPNEGDEKFGAMCFKNGYTGAKKGAKGSEIGFSRNVSLNNIQIIMHHSSSYRNNALGNFRHVGSYTSKSKGLWQVYVNQLIPPTVTLHLD